MSFAPLGLSIIVATSLTNLIWGEPKPPAEHKPYSLDGPAKKVRAMQHATDAVVDGLVDAYERRLGMSLSVAKEFADLDIKEWSDPGKALALIQYVLIGGDPGVLRSILRRGGLGDGQRDLALGVLAFAEKRSDVAVQKLAKIDTGALPSDLSLGVQLAFAASLAESDPVKSLGLLEEIRISAPGTQIEASALRQIVAIHLDVGRSGSALSTMLLYFRRFPSSRFNEQFISQFAAELAQSKDDKLISLLPNFVGELQVRNPEISVLLLVDLSRQAIFRGRLELAMAAGSLAQSLPHIDDDYKLRARLFELVAAAATEKASIAMTELKAINRDRLLPGEIELLDAALGIAAQIPSRKLSDQGDKRSASKGSNSGEAAPPKVKEPEYITRAQSALKSAEQSLAKGRTP